MYPPQGFKNSMWHFQFVMPNKKTLSQIVLLYISDENYFLSILSMQCNAFSWAIFRIMATKKT